MRGRKLGGGAGVALLLVAAAAGGAWLWLARGGRAQRAGQATLPGLVAPVAVRFDRFGAPHVHAGSLTDAAAALGWLHANDRLFQMELTRRAATGRLAELFGARALEFDQHIRRLGFARATERLLAAASPESRALLEAYAAGVNAWRAARDGDLPPEFRLLRHRPEPWRPLDSVAVIFVMGRMLSPVTDPNEVDAFRFLRAFGPARARELVGEREAVIFAEVATLAETVRPAPAPVGERPEGAGLGSNNWAVAPARSANGHALVANDPHLGLGLPNVWYPATLEAPDYHATGVTLAGAPAVVLGRGPRVAWAFTNLYVDDVDLFVEQLDPTGTRVRRGDGWQAVRVEREIVRVSDGREVEVLARATDRGPLLDADAELGLPPRSLAWTGWQPGDQMAALVGLARAGSVAQVPAAIASFTFPAQNLVAADADGHLLWTPIGSAPARFGWDGRFPAPGWRTDVGWDGLVPAAQNPVLLDPEAGLLATANSFLPVALPAWFEGDFDTPFRMERIRALLAPRRDWTLAALGRLQRDTTSLWAQRVVARLGTGYDGEAGRAAEALAAWDGAMAERGPSALFALVERELQRAVFEDEASGAGIPRFGTRWRLLRLLEGELAEAWFDDVATAQPENRRATIARALAAAWRAGVARWGEDVAAWDYAEIHTLTLDHPLGGLPLVGRWFRRGPLPLPGSATTVLAFGGPWQGEAIDVSYGPSLRQLFDAADPSVTLSVLPGGVAGHPGDPHYADQLPLYLAGEYRPVAWSVAEARAAAASELVLAPPAP